ncbi:CD1107 family mobile element protein [Sporosarcina sp. BP05]|uniref:CD1107 family mobile element protein n=1 Tax=Sporosarcina sp. BP05 TaxID=2758726 RepID=UPI0016454A54|nr:DUF4366 domain-containing protein [Sporosarcina sp. BP05]
MKSLKVFLLFSLFTSLFAVSPVLASGSPTPEEEKAIEEQIKVDIPEVKAPEVKEPKKETDKEIVELDIETPASVTGEKMEGNGTVVDFTTSGSKAFYTIVDSEQQVFYLIIDMDKTENNVYFLSDISKSKLEGVPAGKENAPPIPAPGQELESAIAAEPKESGNGFLLLVLLVAAVGVTAYYFLVIKKKQGKGNNEDDEDDEDMMEEKYEDDMIISDGNEEVKDQDNRDDK